MKIASIVLGLSLYLLINACSSVNGNTSTGQSEVYGQFSGGISHTKAK